MENLDYGIIGNCKSAALISKTGSLEWCCLPNFASSAVFAKLLDEKKGGSFEIIVDDSYNITQEYLWETNILNTVFSDGENSFQVIDFMPRYPREDGSFYAPPDVIRFIRLISGKPKFKVKYDPRLDFAREKTYNEFKGNYIKSFTKEGKYDSLFLYSSFDLNDVLEGKELELTGNAYFLLGYHEKLITQSLDRSYLKFQRTKTYWMNWSA
ncbi:trehalase-like domain-containing protein, partial [uncultured Salegentibacter sp.]